MDNCFLCRRLLSGSSFCIFFSFFRNDIWYSWTLKSAVLSQPPFLLLCKLGTFRDTSSRYEAMVVDHLWDLGACWAAESGSATSVFPGAPEGCPAFASGLEEVDAAEISGPGLMLTPRLDRESRVPSGSTIMSITGRVTQGRVSVRVKEHLQKAESPNIITFTSK